MLLRFLDGEILYYDVLEREVVGSFIESVFTVHLQFAVRSVVHTQMSSSMCGDLVTAYRVHDKVEGGLGGNVYHKFHGIDRWCAFLLLLYALAQLLYNERSGIKGFDGILLARSRSRSVMKSYSTDCSASLSTNVNVDLGAVRIFTPMSILPGTPVTVAEPVPYMRPYQGSSVSCSPTLYTSILLASVM